MSAASRKHLEFSPRAFYEYSALIAVIGAVGTTGGLLDIWVMAGLGTAAIAGVGVADLLSAVIFAGAWGIIDIHAAQLSRAEAQGGLARDYSSLALAAAGPALLLMLAALLASLAVSPLLALLQQPEAAIPFAIANFRTRSWLLPLALANAAVPLTMRIAGQRVASFAALLVGLAVKAGLNACIALEWEAARALRPEVAIALATGVAQAATVGLGALQFARMLRRRAGFRWRSDPQQVRRALRDLLRNAPGVGAWNLNDWACTLVVVMLMGRFGTAVLAATHVASRIMTLFYRLPQAFCEAAFVYYGYVSGEAVSVRRARMRTVLRYSLIPTLTMGALLALTATPVARAFSGVTGGESAWITAALIRIHLAFALAYTVQHLASQALAVERSSRFLFWSSAAATYLYVIPTCALVLWSGGSWVLLAAAERAAVAALAVANLCWLLQIWRRQAEAERPLDVVVRVEEVAS